MKKLTFILLAFFVTFQSCKKDDPEIDPPINREEIIISQDITTNTTWYGDKIYKVTNSIDVTSRAVLVIKPGCIIQFSKDTELSIAYSDYGTVIARGTKEEPILFTSDSPKKQAGDWYGLYLYDGSESSEFDHCIFEYAGGYSSQQATINIRGGSSRFINSIVRESASFGYEVRPGGKFEGFAYNTVTKTKYDPMKLTANAVTTLGEFNTFDPGTRIEINRGNLDEPGNHYWEAQPIPYYFSDDLEIGSTSASGTILRIAPGTELQFGNQSIEVSVGFSNEKGQLIAIGEPGKPITFTSSSIAPSQGDWDGIWFYESTLPGSTLENCVISYGGGYSYGGNVVFRNNVGANVTIKNSIISGSQQYGVYKKTGDNAPTLSGNTFSNNAMGDLNW